MNSKEIVRRTLDYDNPIRVAHSYGDSDFSWIGNNVKTHSTDWKKIGPSTYERYDEWGNLWGRIDDTSKGEVLKGVLTDTENVDDYEFPDYSNFADYDIADKNSDKWIVGGMPGFTFNIARKLFKLEDYLVKLLIEEDLVRKVHDKLDLILMDMIKNYAKAGVDSIMFPEDWGTQTQTMISPILWKKEFFPRTKKLCDFAHENKIKVFMHSCGKISEIVPGLMEAGIDLLQFDQPTLHGINILANHQKKGKITFWCPVDIQKTLQTKDETIIRNEAKEMLDKLWQGKGGFVAGFYGDDASIGLESKWQEIASDEFDKAGKRDNYIK